VHATLAGVAVALLVPERTHDGRHVAQHLEHRLHPVASFVVVPLFAVANAGVVIDARAIADAAGSRVAWGILTGLVVGKFVGVCGSVALAKRSGASRLPDGVDTRAFAGGAAATGIGFTVSLFIAAASFPSGSANGHAATVAVLVASTVAAALAVMTLLSRRRERQPRHRELTRT
jgi:Na+:H+ antiporter, NhaA family